MNLKGQSAIEYLTTYGWMLLVIAIVGGTVFTTIQGQTRTSKVSGMTNSEVQVTNFGVNKDGLQMNLRAETDQPVEDAVITIKNSEGEKVEYSANKISSIPVASNEKVTLPGVKQSEVTNTYHVTITYDSGGLQNQQTTGTITGNIKVKFNGTAPAAPTTLQAS